MKSADSTLDILRDARSLTAFKSDRLGCGLSDELVDLVLKVLYLAFKNVACLQSDTGCFLGVVLWLKGLELVLALGKLVLEGSTLGRNQVGSLELVGEICGLVEETFDLDFDNQAEFEMLWVEGTWCELGGNETSYLVLEFIHARSLSLVDEFGSELVGEVGTLGLEVGNGGGEGQVAGKVLALAQHLGILGL